MRIQITVDKWRNEDVKDTKTHKTDLHGISRLTNIDLMPLVYITVLIQSIILAVTHSDFFLRFWRMHYLFKFLLIQLLAQQETWRLTYNPVLCGWLPAR